MEKPKVTGVQHVGIGVRSIEASRAFYRDVLECRIPMADFGVVHNAMPDFFRTSPHVFNGWMYMQERESIVVECIQRFEPAPRPIHKQIRYGDIGVNKMTVEVAKDRVVALGRLARGEVDVLLVPARALLGWLPSPDELSSRIRVARKGDRLPPDRFVLEALASGYRRVEIVSGPGEFSRRGGIIDVFPPNAEEPVRFELFGDAIDSIRSFDTDHQRMQRHRD